MTDDYGKFFFLDDGMEEKISNMSDRDLDLLSSHIAYSLRKTEYKLMEEHDEKPED